MTCRFSKGSVLMNPYLKNYKLKLKALSPVFIGSGKQINKLEYIFDGKRIYVADMNKLMSEVVKRGLAESFYMLMQSHEVYLKEWLDRNGMNDYGQYAAYELNGVENVDSSRSLNGIDTFMRNAYNEPYIPGSSIKGMLRTIILWNEIYDNADNLGKTRDEIKRIVRAAKDVYKRQLIETMYLGEHQRSIRICFKTPCSFKNDGRYMIFPDIGMMYSNLMRKFDKFSGEYSMYDENMFRSLTEKTAVSSYNLRSTAYHLESIKIPSFIGRLTVRNGGPTQLGNLVRLLFAFGEYSGVGVKTALGMGAVAAEEVKSIGKG